MPIYAYRCATCGHAQDVLQKMSDPLLSVCPACGASTYQKQLTAAGFQLKGSGWYVTDFRNGNTGAPAKKDGEGKDGDAKDGAAQDAPTAAPADAAAKPATDSPAAASAAAPAAAPATAAKPATDSAKPAASPRPAAGS